LSFRLLITFATALPALAFTHSDAVKPQVVALTHAVVIDGTGSAAKRDMTVLIEGRRITAIFASGTRSLPASATIKDLSGQFLIPGLIDSHVHIGTQPRDSGVMEAILRNVLMDGVTTVRDMGGSMRIIVPLASRSTSDTAAIPRIYYSAIMAGPGRWFEGAFGENAAGGSPMGQSPLVRRIDANTDVKQVITDARKAGAHAIKIYNGIDATMVRRLADEAHRQHLRVWSHFDVNPARPGDLIAAGVEVVSHADQFRGEVLSNAARGSDSISRALRLQEARSIQPTSATFDRLLGLMKQKGTMLDPTLTIMVPREPPADRSAENMERVYGTFRFAKAMTRRAVSAGIPIVAGTDAIGGSTANLHRELQFLADSVGLTPLQTIRAATLNGALALGMADSLGTIAPGKIADVVILCADPTQSIRNTQAVAAVIKGGILFERKTANRSAPGAFPPQRSCH
jgi:imidazolonepropionase-like amidohydrolase